jgi:hypothetical protein
MNDTFEEVCLLIEKPTFSCSEGGFSLFQDSIKGFPEYKGK